MENRWIIVVYVDFMVFDYAKYNFELIFSFTFSLHVDEIARDAVNRTTEAEPISRLIKNCHVCRFHGFPARRMRIRTHFFLTLTVSVENKRFRYEKNAKFLRLGVAIFDNLLKFFATRRIRYTDVMNFLTPHTIRITPLVDLFDKLAKLRVLKAKKYRPKGIRKLAYIFAVDVSRSF